MRPNQSRVHLVTSGAWPGPGWWTQDLFLTCVQTCPHLGAEAGKSSVGCGQASPWVALSGQGCHQPQPSSEGSARSLVWKEARRAAGI